MSFNKTNASAAGKKSSRKGIKNKIDSTYLDVSYKILYDRLISSFTSGNKYVYYHIDSKTNEVVYIGKGGGDRAWTLTDGSRNKLWDDYKNKNDLKVVIISSMLSDAEALAVEKALIKVKKPKLNLNKC